ncbi:MAG: sugar phosphate isomerase/epimerase family protein [Opitutaceae bacterium]
MNPIGACIWSLPGEGLEAQVKLAAACGLDGVQLDVYSGEGELTLTADSMIELALELRESTGLSYPALGLGVFCERSATDPADHSFLRQVLDDAIEVAVKLDIPLLQIPSFGASELRTAEHISETARLMRYACERAQVAGIQVGTENVLPADQLTTLIQAVDMPNFKVYFDTANPHAMAQLDAIELLEASLPYLAEVHLKDGRDDGEPALLGEGDTGFSATLEALVKVGYKGWYVLESPYCKVMASRGLSAQEVVQADIKRSRL